MDQVPDLDAFLAALGIRTSTPRLAGGLIIALFEVSFVGICVFQAWAERMLGLPPLLVVAAVWVVWTWWHSVLFPRSRLKRISCEKLPYRAAFFRDIYPWVTIGFSQMWRPLFNGDTLADFPSVLAPAPPVLLWSRFALAFALATAALLVMIDAIRTIGFANASFVSEFVAPGTFRPIAGGVYSRLRHPLFAAGALYSVALALAVFTPTALAIAALNCAYVPLYSRLEDRRMRLVFQTAYADYERAVPALTFRLWSPHRGDQKVSGSAPIQRKQQHQRPRQDVPPPDPRHPDA